jgi:hypothetical protein
VHYLCRIAWKILHQSLACIEVRPPSNTAAAPIPERSRDVSTASRDSCGCSAITCKLIAAERKNNKAFIERFTAFADVCRESINPDLKDDAVESNEGRFWFWDSF